MDTHTTSRLLRIGEATLILFGANDLANRRRLTRMVDRGELSAVRIGIRRDRWIVAAGIYHLIEEASANSQRSTSKAER